MIIQKKQTLKRVIYLCLSLAPFILSADTQAGRTNSAYSAKSEGEDYQGTHNRVALKYGFPQRILKPKVPSQSLTLLEAAEKYKEACTNLRKQEEERNQEIAELGKKLLDGGGAIAGAVIDQKIEDETAKNVLLQLKDDVVGFLKGFFN